MRVLHILPSIRGYGAERLIVELLKQLPSREIDAALLTIYEPPAGTQLPFQVLHAGRKNRRDRFFLWRLTQQIRRYKPDIVHTHTHVGKYWGRVAALLAGVPRIVHTEHNPCDVRRTSVERVADRLLHRATSRVVTFFDDQAVLLSELDRLPARKLVAIPNGLMPSGLHEERLPARRRLELGGDQFAILLIGRMEYQKNHILALRSFAALPPQARAKSVLFFAGSGENEIMLRALTHGLKIAERVRFLGYRTDVPELLPGADLVLMTSWFEGMPLALLEAMTAGVPIVTTPWLGSHNMLENGRYGFLTEGFEPDQVAAQIERVFKHPEMRRMVAERAQRHVLETYDMARMAEAHRRMYRQLCGAQS